MAEGTYHRTGAPAVLLATVGPGALNAINVVENARQDRVPMIVLTGCVDADMAETYTHQVLDQKRVFEAVTKASFTLTAGAAHVIIDKALAIATEGRPGPVHIDVPISVAEAPATGEGFLRKPDRRTAPAGRDLEEMREALAKAERPLIVAGVDALDAPDAVRVAAERLCAPVITTYKAKGLLPEDHRLALGGAGLSPKADEILLPLVRRADVILALGYDPIEMRVGWRAPWDPDRQTVIDVTSDANHHYMHHASHAIVGDVAETVSALLPSEPRSGWTSGEVEKTARSLQTAFPRGEAWGPAQAISVCREVLPDDTLATADSGAHRILLSQMWTCRFPRALVQSSGFCTMGCAVPLAMGMQLVEPERTIVSFSGDAGFLMVVGELATAAERRIKTIFVVFVDASLALIERKQRERQMMNIGVDFETTDIACVGRAFGGYGVSVASEAELRDALATAQNADCFSVIAVQIDRKGYDGAF